MDPLSALGLAASVVQFVQLAASLLNGTRKLYNSSSGVSEDSERLEFIHEALRELCLRLEPGSKRMADGVRFVASGLPKDAPSLTDLASRCNRDCKQLLDVVESMKTKSRSGPRIWNSFRAALTEILKANEIEGLQKRIENYQRLMVLHLCSVSSGVIETTEAQVRTIRFEMRSLHSQRSQQLHQLSEAIHGIQERIKGFRSDPDKTSLSSEEVESLTTQVSQLSLSGKELAREHKLLQSLNYERRSVRHEDIPTAHRATFNWIFSDAGSNVKETAHLVEWLAKGQGIFWISGRPGSGKSTLMKFIAGHASTDRLLSTWAGSVPIIKACHYFWSPGTDMQRSQEGLLRSLLYDILSHSSELIRLVCPERWSQTALGSALDFTTWSLSELQSTIHRISSEIQLPFKFCFFIDGLDEFADSHLQLCESLESLSRYPAVKLLLSSRPWNEFEESFGKNPDKKLYLHELTKGDIQRYTESRLIDHPNWKTLALKASDELAMSLISEINSRAHGVFLWVFLVTRQLQQGLTNFDTLSELQRRLHEIPTDLGKFFQIMLESVEPFYHTKMAGTLLLALTARGPLPVTIYSFHDLEYEDKDYALKAETRVWDNKTFRAFGLPLSRRLSSRCKGLLEIQGSRVEFLHRTVRDFLRTAEMNNFLVKKAPEAFDASISIMMAYAAWIKHRKFPGIICADLDLMADVGSVLDSMLSYVDDEAADRESAIYSILNDVEWSLNQRFVEQTNEDGFPSPVSVAFRQRLLRGNLAGYVAAKLDEDDTYLDGQKILPLAVVLGLGQKFLTNNIDQQDSIGQLRLLRDLFRRGHDPNQRNLPIPESLSVKTPWTPWIDLMYSFIRRSAEPRTELLDAGMISLFLDYGADVNVPFHTKGSPIWVEFLLYGLRTEYDSCVAIDQEKYIEALEKMLSMADFEAPTILLATSHYPPQPKTVTERVIETCRQAMFYLIADKLRHSLQKPNYFSFHRLAKTVEVFLKHAASPSVSPDEIQSAICEVFPPALSTSLMGVIRSLYPDEGCSTPARKRGRPIVENTEDACDQDSTGKRRG